MKRQVKTQVLVVEFSWPCPCLCLVSVELVSVLVLFCLFIPTEGYDILSLLLRTKIEGLIVDIKLEFRDHASLTDEKEISNKMTEAMAGQSFCTNYRVVLRRLVSCG
jgi:hypothetical protein